MSEIARESDQARAVAERIARRLAEDSAEPLSGPRMQTELGAELAAMRASLAALQRRLGQLEARVHDVPMQSITATSQESAPPVMLRTHSPWLGGVNASVLHPSQEKFGVEEAAITQLVDFFQSDKQCTVEPGGKPCDHCAMCSSRGF